MAESTGSGKTTEDGNNKREKNEKLTSDHNVKPYIFTSLTNAL